MLAPSLGWHAHCGDSDHHRGELLIGWGGPEPVGQTLSMLSLGSPEIVEFRTSEDEAKCSIHYSPNKRLPVFLLLTPRYVSLWSLKPLCLLSHLEHPAAFVEETGGGYRIGRLGWADGEGRVFDVERCDGHRDRYQIIDAPASIFPIAGSAMALSTPKYGLVLEASAVPRGQMMRASASPTLTMSNLHETVDGIVGQRTSDGFCVFEYRSKMHDRAIDLKGLQLFLPLAQDERVEDRMRVSSLGRLAWFTDCKLSVGRLTGALSRTATEEKTLTLKPLKIFWLDEALLSVHVINERLVVKDVHLDATLLDIEGEDPCEMLAIEIDASHRSLLVLLKAHDHRVRLYSYPLPLQASPSGPLGRAATFECADQILHLRLSPDTLMGNSPGAKGSLDLHDHSLLWECFDIPLKSSSWMRKVAIDSERSWIAAAGESGFCLCSLELGRWILPVHEGERGDVIVEHQTWIRLERGEDPLLAVVLVKRSSQRREFWILSPTRELKIANLLHRQETQHEILALDSCGPGLLGILTAEHMLQVVLVQRDASGNIDMSLLISASVLSFADACLDKHAWRFYFVQDVPWEAGRVNLFVVLRGDLLFTVRVPLPESAATADQPTSRIAASIIKAQDVEDFWIWHPADQLWLIVKTRASYQCHKWPFSEEPDMALAHPAATRTAFYPEIGGGLLVLLESEAHMGWERRDHYKLVIHQTVSLAPLLLVSQLAELEDEQFIPLLQAILAKQGSIDARIFLMELFLNEILKDHSLEQQALLFPRAAGHIVERVGPEAYRSCVANFLRRIELGDAWRIQRWLGPIEKLMEASHTCLFVLTSLFVLADPRNSSLQVTGATCRALLHLCLAQQSLTVFAGVCRLLDEYPAILNDSERGILVDRIVLMRAWDFLKVLQEAGWEMRRVAIPKAELCQRTLTMLLRVDPREWKRIVELLSHGESLADTYSTTSDSPIVTMLHEADDDIEAALWALIRDGEVGRISRAILASKISRADLEQLFIHLV